MAAVACLFVRVRLRVCACVVTASRAQVVKLVPDPDARAAMYHAILPHFDSVRKIFKW